MKDYIEDKYGWDSDASYRQLRAYVCEAWEAVPEAWLRELLASMPQRCQDVIDAKGYHQMVIYRLYVLGVCCFQLPVKCCKA